MLHGNGSTTDELDASGLIEEASRKYRVLAFDRPGFGHSERPRGVLWSAARQADLIDAAMERLGVRSAIVFAHSWGALVAMNLALRHPERVRALALESGYYFATLRADAFLMSPPAIPLIGDVISRALSPLIGRLTWERQIRKMFDPAPIPDKFRAYSPEMALRPSQLHASAEESALMIWEARALEEEYGKIRVPVVLLAGEGDQMADVGRQSRELHEAMPASILRVIRGVGHMVHQTDPSAALAAIDDAARLSERGVAQAADANGASAGA
jgi:pimeloyl-ACP methyl ester carboxylesterase